MRDPATRALIALHTLAARARRDDRGQSSAEYLMWGAVIVGIIGLVLAPRMQGILSGVMDAIDNVLPG